MKDKSSLNELKNQEKRKDVRRRWGIVYITELCHGDA